MINIEEIKDNNLETLICKFDESISCFKTLYGFELKSYGNFLRIVLNNLQPDSFNNLIERVNINREIERILDNAGGYSIEFLGENNPKTYLLEIIHYLNKSQLKFQRLYDFIKASVNRKIIVADNVDVDYLVRKLENRSCKIISHSEFQNTSNLENCLLIFYSFNGKKDFDILYNLKNNISLLLYSQEVQLYNNQLQKRKHQIEEELVSDDRYLICDISYEPIIDLPVQLNRTLRNVVDRIDAYSKGSYENYKDETDSLLEEIEEKVTYKISFNQNTSIYIDSNESVFAQNGDLVKMYRLKTNESIRVFPKDHFAESLYRVAVDTDKEVFGKVEEHSKAWLNILMELKNVYKDGLYNKLKANGMRVLPSTVEGYFNASRKFPMYNSDLKAIYKSKYNSLSVHELTSLLEPIIKSKTIYNSTMIALGRGIKQEIKLFIKEGNVGDILAKLHFTRTTLEVFIDTYMPLCTVTSKEIL